MRNYKNVIYILTNPLYAGYVKIGYASDLLARLASLNTGMLRNFEPYAVFETNVKNADKNFHAIIDDLAPIVRARVINGQKVQDKEFFKLEPEQAYDILQHIAKMTGTESHLHRKEDGSFIMPAVSPYQQESPVHPNPHFHRSHSAKPISFSIQGQSYPFQSWTKSLEQQCQSIIQSIGFDSFRSIILSAPVSCKFTETEQEQTLRHYGFSQGTLYMCVNYSSPKIQKIQKEIAHEFSSYGDFSILYTYPSES